MNFKQSLHTLFQKTLFSQSFVMASAWGYFPKTLTRKEKGN